MATSTLAHEQVDEAIHRAAREYLTSPPECRRHPVWGNTVGLRIRACDRRLAYGKSICLSDMSKCSTGYMSGEAIMMPGSIVLECPERSPKENRYSMPAPGCDHSIPQLSSQYDQSERRVLPE